jgi:hypothetical protein
MTHVQRRVLWGPPLAAPGPPCRAATLLRSHQPAHCPHIDMHTPEAAPARSRRRQAPLPNALLSMARACCAGMMITPTSTDDYVSCAPTTHPLYLD